MLPPSPRFSILGEVAQERRTLRWSLEVTPMCLATCWPIFENHEAGNGLNAEALGQLGTFVDIDFCDGDRVIYFVGQLLQYGEHLPARATPFGPEVKKDGAGGVFQFGFEGARVELFDF